MSETGNEDCANDVVEETPDNAMEASTNGETLSAKIPKLMDISAIYSAPKLMGVGTSGSAASAAPTSMSHTSSSSSSSAPLLPAPFSPSITLEQIRATQHKFIDDRDWHRYHTPRNLLLAMVGEVGELSELFQWRGEVGVGLPGWSDDDRRHLRHELADVFLYLVRLSEQCSVDLPNAVLEKIALNERKYPAELVRGSSKKYSEYPDGTKLAKPQDENAGVNEEAP